jgi:hypothetical protein
VPVAAGAAAPSPKGKTRVTVLHRGLEVVGTVDGARLGLCVQKEVPALAVDGKVIGKVHPGALVRVVPGAGKPGHVLVETAGAFGVRLQVPRDALAAVPTDVVLGFDWNYRTAKPTVLYATQALEGNGFVRLPEGVRVEAYEQAGDVLHVRTAGGVELDGWTPASNLVARVAEGVTPPDPDLIKPTHEVFLDAPIFADSAGKKVIGTLRGGALVEVNPKATANDDTAVKLGHVKVLTPSPVVVEGWMKKADLRQLPGDAKGLGAPGR